MEYFIVSQNGWKNDFNKADPGAFFHDRVRKIDLVLAYEDPSESEDVEPPEDNAEKCSEKANKSDSRVSSANSSAETSGKNGKEIGLKRKKARETFEKNLQSAGMELEHENRKVRLCYC